MYRMAATRLVERTTETREHLGNDEWHETTL